MSVLWHQKIYVLSNIIILLTKCIAHSFGFRQELGYITNIMHVGIHPCTIRLLFYYTGNCNYTMLSVKLKVFENDKQ